MAIEQLQVLEPGGRRAVVGATVGRAVSQAAGEEAAPHFVQLDALRAFAVGGVLLHHFLPVSTRVAPFGALGVKLFFVLSGFLITGILLQGKALIESGGQSVAYTLRQFYIRRFLRIFPLFYFVLLLAALLNIYPTRETLPWHLFYLSNVYITATGDWPGALSPFWTLAVEEQFYLVWPWVVLYTPRRHLLKCVIAVIAVAPLFRLLILGLGWNQNNWAVLPFACLDTLGSGALLAVLANPASASSAPVVGQRRGWREPSARFGKRGIALGGLLLVTELLLIATHRAEGFSFLTFDLVMAWCCVWLLARATQGVGGAAGRLLENRVLVYLGVISYGIYVYHGFMQLALDYGLGQLRQQPLRVMALLGGALLLMAGGLVVKKSRVWLWTKLQAAARALQPLFIVQAITGVAVLLFYGAQKAGVLSLAVMNAAIYLLLSSVVSVTVAAISWHLLERPINRLKARFPYRATTS